jgi:hypothetical protein
LFRHISSTSSSNQHAGATNLKLLSRTKRPSRKDLCSVDSQILRVLAQNRFANSYDLRARLPGLPDQYNIFRRLRYLGNLGLVEPLIGDGGNRLGYRLTKKGVAFTSATDHVNSTMSISRPMFRSQFDHDQIVNEVRGILSTSPIVSNFVSETELRSRNEDSRKSRQTPSRDWKVPDAMFSLYSAGTAMTTALEIELTQKAKARYSKIVEALLTSKSFQLVFVVCKDENLVRLIAQAVHDARAKNPAVRASNRSNGVYFSAVDLLRERTLDAPWFGEGTSFTLNGLASNKDLTS